MSGEPTETCLFFVDDSNLWIEAQKLAASGNSRIPKLADSDHDPRLRINLGKLLDTICNRRSLGPSILYGSRPPPNDLVWKAAEKHKFDVKVYDRARGKEKEVDNSMATDLSYRAAELTIRAQYDPQFEQEKANTTFVVITGDRDICPPVSKVLESGIRVELWALKSALSKELIKMNFTSGLMSIYYVDEIFDQISFTSCSSTRKAKWPKPSQTLVLCEFADPDQNNLYSSVKGQLMQLGRLFYTSQPQTGTELFVEFPRVPNMEAIILQTRGLFKESLTVLAWPEYAARFQNISTAIFETGNIYEPLVDGPSEYATSAAAEKANEPVGRKAKLPSTAEPEPRNKDTTELQGGHKENQDIQSPNDPDDSGGWEAVSRSNQERRNRRDILKTQRCSYGIRCQKRGDCGSRHTNEEKDIFQKWPNLNFKYWKTRMCMRDNSHRGKDCPYAHTPDEAWCGECFREGHVKDDCQLGMQN